MKRAIFVGMILGLTAFGAACANSETKGGGSGAPVSRHLSGLQAHTLNTGVSDDATHRPKCAVTVQANSDQKRVSLLGLRENQLGACPMPLLDGHALTFECADDGKCANDRVYGTGAHTLAYKLTVLNDSTLMLFETDTTVGTNAVVTQEYSFR